MAVVGVDACKAGWVGIRLADDHGPVALCATTIEELVGRAGAVDVVGIDIPIGLPPGPGPRAADVLARAALGPRRASIFMTPPRAVLEALSHATATQLAVEISGKGVSRQAYGLAPKILEVDAWLDRAEVRVVEVHPEVSFAALAGSPLPEPKSSWAGFHLRQRLLAGAGIVLDGDVGLSGLRVGVDDVLDAGVVAWTAQRVRRGEAVSLPDPPEMLGPTVAASIWA